MILFLHLMNAETIYIESKAWHLVQVFVVLVIIVHSWSQKHSSLLCPQLILREPRLGGKEASLSLRA